MEVMTSAEQETVQLILLFKSAAEHWVSNIPMYSIFKVVV